MNNLNFIALSLFGILLFSCKNEDKEVSSSGNDTTTIADLPPIEVEIGIAKRGIFYKEITSNGKISAVETVEMRFIGSNKIKYIYVKNGQQVKNGDIIAELDNYEIKIKLGQAQARCEKTKIDLADVLITQGYNLSDSLSIPKEVLEIAKIRSGFIQASADYELALFEYSSSVLISPINGLVANLTSKEMNYNRTGEPFCTILGTSVETYFTILESELPLVKTSQKVEVCPYFDQSYTVNGTISEINPLVDKNGLVTIKAVITGINNKLYEGMNVKINIKSGVTGKLIVPKTAVTPRSEKKVVFTYKNGKAQWNYVQIGLENSTSYTIEEGLSDNDTIIVQGNLHLGHEAPVTIK